MSLVVRARKPKGVALFQLSPEADTDGITEMGVIEVPPASVVRRFGPPHSGDGHKISGEYVFIGQTGDVFVAHDWKATSLWEGGLETPEEFWSKEEPDELSVSSRDIATDEFEGWFLDQLNRGTP